MLSSFQVESIGRRKGPLLLCDSTRNLLAGMGLKIDKVSRDSDLYQQKVDAGTLLEQTCKPQAKTCGLGAVDGGWS